MFKQQVKNVALLAAFVLLFGFSTVQAKPTITVKSADHNPLPVRPEVFGVHGELLWSRLRIGSEAFEEAYHELGFNFIRLPGGTTANLYLWQIPRFACNGEISDKKADRAPKFNNALKKKGRTYTFKDFVAFLKGSQTRFSYVVNVICDTQESTAKLARAFKEAGIELTRVEMGNELNFEEYLPGNDAGNNYISLIEPHVEAVREVFPNVKIGGVVSTAAYRSLRFPDLAAMKKNKHDGRDVAFDEAVAAYDGVDAFVPHMYSTFGLAPGGFFSFNSEEITNEKIYLNAVAHFDRRTPAAVNYLTGLRPGAEVWITEWGVAFWGETREYALDFNTSHFASLYFANALRTYALLPAVTAANYHNFPDFIAYAPGMGKQGEPSRVSLFHAAKLLSQLFVDEGAVVTPLVFDGEKAFKSGHKSFPGNVSSSSGLEVNKGGLRKLLVINKTAETKLYDLKSYCLHERGCFAESLIHLPAAPGKDYKTESRHLESAQLELPGYSFSVITIR